MVAGALVVVAALGFGSATLRAAAWAWAARLVGVSTQEDRRAREAARAAPAVARDRDRMRDDTTSAAPTAASRSEVAFTPAGTTLSIAFERPIRPGALVVRATDDATARLTIDAASGEVPDVVLLTDGVRVRNAAAPDARYTLDVPGTVRIVSARLGVGPSRQVRTERLQGAAGTALP